MAEINKINIKGVDYDIGGGGSNDLVIDLELGKTTHPFWKPFYELLLSLAEINDFLFNINEDAEPRLDMAVLETITAEALTNYGYDINKIAQGDYNNIIVNFEINGKMTRYVFNREYVAPLGSTNLGFEVPISSAYILKLSYGNEIISTYSKVIIQIAPMYEAATDSENTYKISGFSFTLINQLIV